jgi:hypothetical protein
VTLISCIAHSGVRAFGSGHIGRYRQP